MRDAYEILVIGAGPAGTSAALRAAELGASVAIVDAKRTGGTCVNTGCVPTRVLAKTARLMREVRTADTSGITVTEQTIDWRTTVARVRSTVERVLAAKDEPDRLGAAGVDLLLEGRARFIGPHEVELEATGRRIRAESVILCVGGHTRRLPVPGADLATLPEQVLDLPELPRRLPAAERPPPPPTPPAAERPRRRRAPPPPSGAPNQENWSLSGSLTGPLLLVRRRCRRSPLLAGFRRAGSSRHVAERVRGAACNAKNEPVPVDMILNLIAPVEETL